MGKHARDYEVLVPQRKRKATDDDLAFNHVSKKQLKGSEIVFDPAKHRDFITGFRKRKQQRRLEAQNMIKKKERQVRNESRAERRAKLKEELGLGDNWGASSDDEPEKQPSAAAAARPAKSSAAAVAVAATGTEAPSVAVYEQQGTRTIVTTAPLSLYPESEEDQASEEGDEDEEGQGTGAHAGGYRDKPRQQNNTARTQNAAIKMKLQRKPTAPVRKFGKKKPDKKKEKKGR